MTVEAVFRHFHPVGRHAHNAHLTTRKLCRWIGGHFAAASAAHLAGVLRVVAANSASLNGHPAAGLGRRWGVHWQIDASAETNDFLENRPRRFENATHQSGSDRESNRDAADRRPWSWFAAEQVRIIRLLIERIDVAPDGISLTLHAAGIRSLVAEVASEEAAVRAAKARREAD